MSITIETDGVTVRRLNEENPEEWNDLVERSPQTNPFHYWESLEVQAEHGDVEFHPLVGYKGQEPVGLFPVFEKRKARLRMALSAAPSLRIPYLGPALLNYRKLKRRKREHRTKRFVRGCLDWIDRVLDPVYVQVRPDPQFCDVRPFEWADFDIEVRHTYRVDLTPDDEELLLSFSSDARNNVRTEGDYRVYEGGPPEIDAVISQVQARYDEQDKRYGVTPAFVTDLYDRLPEGAVRPYACEIDGEIATGMVAVELGDTVYRWQGGTKHDHDLPVNDLVDWTIMSEAKERGVTNYDLVGANEERLCGYKAKFGPELQSYYRMDRDTPAFHVLSALQNIPDIKHVFWGGSRFVS